MKYLEYTPLDRISEFLSHVNLGERTVKGCLEPYSCKHTGTDKKLSLSLENEILDYLGKSSDTDSSSPVDYLCCRSSRKTLIYLLLTLNHMYPDYDFSFLGDMASHYIILPYSLGSVVRSAVNAHQFFTEENWDSFKQIFDTYMFEASKEWLETNEDSPLLETLYKALDEVVKVTECEIYSYNPEADADPLHEKGTLPNWLEVTSICLELEKYLAIYIDHQGPRKHLCIPGDVHFSGCGMHLFNFVSNLVQVGLRFVIELDLHSVNGVGICDKVRDTWRRLKRIVSFRFSCVSNLALVDALNHEEDGEIFDGMDM
nr:repressor of RNA polymerase III transcription MAF1 homolog isoform X1 [Ipomoea batatas]